jgi:hypothetical protein
VQLAVHPDATVGVFDSGRPSSVTRVTRLRPYLTAGVAVACAGLIAANPTTPTLPDIQARAVQLTSSITTDIADFGSALVPVLDTLGGDTLSSGTLDSLNGILDGGLLGGLFNGLNLSDLSGVLSGLDLANLPSPITAYLDLFNDTFTNLGTIFNDVLSDPFPVLQQILANQVGFADTISTGLQSIGSALSTGLGELPAQLQTLFGDLASGNITGAASVLNDDILLNLLVAPGINLISSGILNIPGEIAQNFANVITQTIPDALLEPVLLGPLSALETTITQAGASGQAIVDAIGSGNLLTAFGDFVAAPAQIADTFLNDGAGLLTFNNLVDGLLVSIPQAIAQALGAPAADVAGSLVPSLAGALDPLTALGDIGTMFDPALVTDITTMLSADLVPNLVSGLLMDLPSMLLSF